jgi:DNA-binding transcriptional ArsR family regulator
MSERNFPHPKLEEVELPDLLFALSDPTRLGIVSMLADGAEHSAGEVAGGIPKSTMSHHLKILREAGLTRTQPDGMRCRITLRRAEVEHRFPGMLDAILRHAAK